jgi:hypothetical protein
MITGGSNKNGDIRNASVMVGIGPEGIINYSLQIDSKMISPIDHKTPDQPDNVSVLSASEKLPIVIFIDQHILRILNIELS